MKQKILFVLLVFIICLLISEVSFAGEWQIDGGLEFGKIILGLISNIITLH